MAALAGVAILAVGVYVLFAGDAPEPQSRRLFGRGDPRAGMAFCALLLYPLLHGWLRRLAGR